MAHWKLTLSYDGSRFHGWQMQPGLRTVQGDLAEALRSVVGEAVLPQGSGRTDAGVHALAQVASFALRAPVPPANLRRALNRVLAGDVRVETAEHAPPEFHARHSATGKHYEYRIFERRRAASAEERVCSPFAAPFVWDCRWPLDLERMQAAAQAVVGAHDFTSFAATDADAQQRSEAESGIQPVKTIFASSWSRTEEVLVYRVHGSGFLHHMVRNLVGTFVDVGRGALEPGRLPAILAARDRSAAGPTAPARGLFLSAVDYGARR